jgi:hypothetical protein
MLRTVMAINIPHEFDDEDFAACLVRRYLWTDPTTGRARFSGAHFERIGGGGDRPDAAARFTTEDLLAVSMLSVRIDGYHALEILCHQASELNGLLAKIPTGIALQDPGAGAFIAENESAWKLWAAVCDIEPRPDSNRIGPIAAGKLLARKRPELLPVYDSRIKMVLKRPRIDNRWWHDLHHELITNQNFVQKLESVREKAGAGHMSLLRVFDVMCWMFSWPSEALACELATPD